MLAVCLLLLFSLQWLEHKEHIRVYWLYRREFRGKLRAPGSKEEEEGEIAGRWFIILLDVTNTLSPPKGTFLFDNSHS